MRNRWITSMALALGLAVAPLAHGYDAVVEKKIFTIPTFTTVGGKTIRNVRIGYDVRHAERQRHQRDLRRALLLRHFACRRQVQAGRCGAGLL